MAPTVLLLLHCVCCSLYCMYRPITWRTYSGYVCYSMWGQKRQVKKVCKMKITNLRKKNFPSETSSSYKSPQQSRQNVSLPLTSLLLSKPTQTERNSTQLILSCHHSQIQSKQRQTEAVKPKNTFTVTCYIKRMKCHDNQSVIGGR